MTKSLLNPNVSKLIIDSHTEQIEENFPETFPACVVTRSMMKKKVNDHSHKDSHTDYVFDLSKTFLGQELIGKNEEPIPDSLQEKQNVDTFISRERLIAEQEKDSELATFYSQALHQEEAKKVPTCYILQDDILMRKWRPLDTPAEEAWNVVYQIMVPKKYRQDIISLAHDSLMAGHLGVTKMYNKIRKHFYWPKLKGHVSQYCNSCHICQITGKPNQVIPPAPLYPIPAFGEPFSRILIDCVGPLPKTKSGNVYLLTIMCAATRFPEAIPLRNIKARNICKALQFVTQSKNHLASVHMN